MIFVFNPETEIVLASGKASYTPSRGVREVRRRFTPIIASVLRPGDSILVFSQSEKLLLLENENMQEYTERGISIVDSTEIQAKLKAEHQTDLGWKPVAWGWNVMLRSELIQCGFNIKHLPSELQLCRLRELAHRRTTIAFNDALNRLLDLDAPLPREFFSPDEALAEIDKSFESFIKSPWSSSGRGVFNAASLTEKELETRINSVIRKQGSIIIEDAASKQLDFATEWFLHGGKAEYLGLSVFNISGLSRYGNNLLLSQAELDSIIRQASPGWSNAYIQAQKVILESLIAPSYEGPLGIDMLADRKGRIRPCIEINPRHTMGHVALALTGVAPFARYGF